MSLVNAGEQSQLLIWQQVGIIRPLDVALVQLCQQQTQAKAPAQLWSWLALASAQVAQGHLCLDLELTFETPASLLPVSGRFGRGLSLLEQFVASQDLPSVMAMLAAYRDIVTVALGPGQAVTPFVLAESRLYLYRYWQYEQQIKAFIVSCQQQDRTRFGDSATEIAQLQQTLQRLYADSHADPDWQRMACALAATRSFSVITGGPGTGKTTTVVKLLLLLQQMAAAKPLHIALAAPTGKAAARLTESIAGAIHKLSGRPELANLPWQAVALQAQTIHRLLGTVPGRNVFRHHQGRKLPIDVLVIDEASMVDVELMSAVLQALPAKARLILLGDKDQLASVEAGAILGELCKEAEQGGYSEETAQLLATLTLQSVPQAFISANPGPLEQHIVMLRTSHRFASTSAIGQLAQAVNAGDERKVQQLLSASPAMSHGDTGDYICPLQHPNWLQHLVLGADERQGLWPLIRQLQQPMLDMDAKAKAMLETLGQFQILCALRQGQFGVEQLNSQIEQLLRQQRLIARQEQWYAGRPVMISQNDYTTGLMNGDIGICLPVQEGSRELLKVAFATAQGIRWFLPSRLPALETVFAMTVHKSQGSEFKHAVLVLPEQTSPVLTRELLYTGITRAAERFTVVANDVRVMLRAVNQPTERRGGLRL